MLRALLELFVLVTVARHEFFDSIRYVKIHGFQTLPDFLIQSGCIGFRALDIFTLQISPPLF